MSVKTRFTLPESETTTNDILVSENIEQVLSNKKFKDNNGDEYTIDDIPKLNTENTFTKNQTINAVLKANNFNSFYMPETWDDTKSISENLSMGSFKTISPCYRTISNFPASFYTSIFLGASGARSFILTCSKYYNDDDIRVYFNGADGEQDFNYTDKNKYSRLLTHRNFNAVIPNVAYTNVENTFTAAQTINGTTTINGYTNVIHNGEFPFKATVETLTNNASRKIGIGDGVQTAIVGIEKTNDGIYQAYYKLVGQSASIAIEPSKIKFQGKMETNQTTPNNAFDTNLKKCLLQLMYPVGSVYMSATSHKNPNDIFGVNIGTWTEIPDNRFLLASNSSRTLRETGGDVNHQHGYGIAYAAFYENIHGYDDDHIRILHNNNWTNIAQNGSVANVLTHRVDSQYASASSYYGTYNTTSGGSWNPWYRVHAWYRSA